LIVSAVKSCKQCLQTASAFGALFSIPRGASSLDPLHVYCPQMKIPGDVNAAVLF